MRYAGSLFVTGINPIICDFFLFLPTKTCYVPSMNVSSKWKDKLGQKLYILITYTFSTHDTFLKETPYKDFPLGQAGPHCWLPVWIVNIFSTALCEFQDLGSRQQPLRRVSAFSSLDHCKQQPQLRQFLIPPSI